MPRVTDFTGPKTLCRWAREEVRILKVAIHRFIKENLGTEFEEFNYLTNVTTYGCKIPEQATDEIARAAYRTVNELRNALDQAVFAASCILTDSDVKKAAFPFADTRKEVTGSLTSGKAVNYKEIPRKLHSKLISFNPWFADDEGHNGNDILRSLGVIANPNKHILPITVELAPSHKVFGFQGNIIWLGNHNRGNGEIELFKYLPGIPFKRQTQFDIEIVFTDAARLTGKPILSALNELVAMTDRIVLEIEAETVLLKG